MVVRNQLIANNQSTYYSINPILFSEGLSYEDTIPNGGKVHDQFKGFRVLDSSFFSVQVGAIVFDSSMVDKNLYKSDYGFIDGELFCLQNENLWSASMFPATKHVTVSSLGVLEERLLLINGEKLMRFAEKPVVPEKPKFMVLNSSTCFKALEENSTPDDFYILTSMKCQLRFLSNSTIHSAQY